MWAIAGVMESGKANRTDSVADVAGLTWAIR